MSDVIREQVGRLLAEAGVTFGATYRGLKQNALNDTHPMDKWECEFTSGRANETFEFFTGIGLRAEPTATQKQSARFRIGDGLTDNDIRRRTILGRKYWALLETLRTPQPPHAADVLHSLIFDASACEQSFASWCADYGYDEDSRKAETLYYACQANGDKLARIIPHDTRQALADALQEY